MSRRGSLTRSARAGRNQRCAGLAVLLLIGVGVVSCGTREVPPPSAPTSTHEAEPPPDPLAVVEAAAEAGEWVRATELLGDLDPKAYVTTSEIRGDRRYLVGSTFYFALPGVPNGEELFS